MVENDASRCVATRQRLFCHESLRAFVDGYRAKADVRCAFPDALVRRTWAMYELLRNAHRDSVDSWGSSERIDWPAPSPDESRLTEPGADALSRAAVLMRKIVQERFDSDGVL